MGDGEETHKLQETTLEVTSRALAHGFQLQPTQHLLPWATP